MSGLKGSYLHVGDEVSHISEGGQDTAVEFTCKPGLMDNRVWQPGAGDLNKFRACLQEQEREQNRTDTEKQPGALVQVNADPSGSSWKVMLIMEHREDIKDLLKGGDVVPFFCADQMFLAGDVNNDQLKVLLSHDESTRRNEATSSKLCAKWRFLVYLGNLCVSEGQVQITIVYDESCYDGLIQISVCLICNEDGVPYLMSPNMCFSQQYLALAVVKEQLSVEVLKICLLHQNYNCYVDVRIHGMCYFDIMIVSDNILPDVYGNTNRRRHVTMCMLIELVSRLGFGNVYEQGSIDCTMPPSTRRNRSLTALSLPSPLSYHLSPRTRTTDLIFKQVEVFMEHFINSQQIIFGKKSVFAAYLLEDRNKSDRDRFEVVAFGSGTKWEKKIECSSLVKLDQFTYDFHAEAIANQSFNRYLINEMKKSCNKEESVFEFHPPPLVQGHRYFNLQPNVRFHFVCSKVPCGDAAKSLYAVESWCNLCTKSGTIDNTQYCMEYVIKSCTDKIGKWMKDGVQDHIVHPYTGSITLQTIIISTDKTHSHECQDNARVALLRDSHAKTKVIFSKEIIIRDRNLPIRKKQKSGWEHWSYNWCKGDTKVERIDTRDINKSDNQGSTQICKHKMYQALNNVLRLKINLDQSQDYVDRRNSGLLGMETLDDFDSFKLRPNCKTQSLENKGCIKQARHSLLT